MKYTVICEKGDSTWGAYVPDLPGVIAAGDSREEVESLIREAEFQVEVLKAEGLTVPPLDRMAARASMNCVPVRGFASEQ